MARKIEATPTLRGKAAKKFIADLKREPTIKEKKNFMKHVKKHFLKLNFLIKAYLNQYTLE